MSFISDIIAVSIIRPILIYHIEEFETPDIAKKHNYADLP